MAILSPIRRRKWSTKGRKRSWPICASGGNGTSGNKPRNGSLAATEVWRTGLIHGMRGCVRGALLCGLRTLLDELDPARDWGGLRKVLTPEGHYLWLCDHHAEEYAR